MKNKIKANIFKKHLCLMSFVLCLFMFSGCKVGPNYSRPETVIEVNDTFIFAGNHEQDVNALTSSDKWWENFGDPVTSELVEAALTYNYDLQGAAARVLQAQASLSEAKGVQWPELSYSTYRSRNKQSMNLGSMFGGGRFSFLNTTWSQEISATYILDLFGKLKRIEKAAWADMLTMQTNAQALTNSVIASVVNARINIAIAQKRLALARENIASQEQTLAIVQRSYEEGLVGPLDIRLARENLASLKSIEPALELQLITAQNALDVMLGRRPGSSESLPETLEDLPTMGNIPIGLPATLLERRPDIKAAEFTLIAANERVGVSISQLYPNLSLTSSYGFSGDTAEEIYIEDFPEMYSLIINLAQPIFKGGQIKAQIKAAKARYEELAANYAGTVLNALREVEDALITEQKLKEQLEQAQIQLTEARAAEDLSRQRYQNGIEGILAVLESERISRSAQEQLIILKGQIWSSRVNLHLALGGDWNETQKTYAAKK